VKRLTVVRHAKSSSHDDTLADHERPLAERGERDAPRMGERLRVRGEYPDSILTSSAKRALATAELIARAIGYPPQALRIEPALYLADAQTILDVVGSQDDVLDHLMIVGHNPGLTDLIDLLVPDLRLDNLPTSGIVAIDSTARRWAELGSPNASVAYVDYPKKHKER
jgi:phosphohistidine phosphatase